MIPEFHSTYSAASGDPEKCNKLPSKPEVSWRERRKLVSLADLIKLNSTQKCSGIPLPLVSIEESWGVL